MSANTTNRSAIRKQLGSLLTTALVGTGLPVQHVYSYQVADFNKQSPVVVVTSGATDTRQRQTMGERSKPGFVFVVHVFVLYALEDGSWTEEQSEDRLDLIEKEVADFVLDHQVEAGYWSNIDYDGRTLIEPITGDDGEAYRHEAIALRVQVFDA